VKFDPGTHIGMHSVLALKLGVAKLVIRAVLTVGRKPRVVWTFLRTYSLQNYFSQKVFSFILVFLLLMLFKMLSYSLLFLNFRRFVLAAQPARDWTSASRSDRTKRCVTPAGAAT
jgi:hypothetical protein